jgi:hypothetical protein
VILKASQRAGGMALATHLLRTDENDHVEVHQVRGFIKNNVIDAFKEAYAVSRGTKCKQFLFSLSLSPPADETVSVAVFERAIDKIEMRLGLVGQPRAIVFHEKDGRRHAHCVWSRINAKTMRAVPVSHFKLKLAELSRELFLEHGWKMPRGLVKSDDRNPLNFTLAEWQQAKRLERDPKRIKQIFQDCWAISDSLPAFQSALEARGYYLARGDRRGFVAVDWQGEIYSISRWCGVKTAEVTRRLGDGTGVRPVEEVKNDVLRKVAEKEKALTPEPLIQVRHAQSAMKAKRDALVASQRAERAALEDRLAARWQAEEIARAARFRKGLKGLWDWLIGRRAETTRRNEEEVRLARERDALERQRLVEAHLKVRRELQIQVQSVRSRKDRALEGAQIDVGSRRMNVPSITVPIRQRRRQGPSPSQS